MRLKLVFVILLLLLITGEILFLAKISKHYSPFSGESSIENWERYIKRYGPAASWQEFKRIYQNDIPGRQHSKAHVFGEALFNVESINGIDACDNSFAFGCFHSFLGKAIEVKGIEVVADLDRRCMTNLKEQGLGCQHGIGHGIVTNFGYSYEDLTKSLETCDNLATKDPIGGCFGGVFMEYNLRTILEDKAGLREFNPLNPYDPCPKLKDKFRPACYYWQTQWWENSSNKDEKVKYKEIGLLCFRITKEDERKQCFIGLGNIAPQNADWNLETTKDLCHQIDNEQGKIFCLTGAAGAFHAEPKTREISSKACDLISSEKYRNGCLQFRGSNIMKE